MMWARRVLFLASALVLAAASIGIAAISNAPGPGRPRPAGAAELPRITFVAAPGSSILLDGPYGDRWVKAVEGTAGQVLLYGGRPADTVYFSTSKGTTLGNDTVFGSAPLPYLRPVKEHDDAASPLSHWSVTLPFGDLARFL